MTEESKQQEVSPSEPKKVSYIHNPFHQVAFAFVHNLDSLKEMIDPLRVMANIIAEQLSDEHLKVLELRGSLTSQDEKEKRFTLPIRHFREVERKRKKHARAVRAAELLPRTFLVSLVSEFDVFLGRLIRTLFQACPEKLNGSERVLTYSDLVKFSSMANARDHIVEAEVESVLRQSHAKQFDWLEKTFGIELRKGLARWPAFVELTERRNLFVHCDGVVSSQYLKVCSDHKVELTDSTVGAKLGINRPYLLDAYKCLFEIGIKLTQVLWRKLLVNELILADESLTDFVLELLSDGQYDLAIRLSEFAVDGLPRHGNEIGKRMFIVNLAQAYKFSGEEAKCRNRLGKEDWSACGQNFELCIHVLKDEFDQARDVMKKIGANGSIEELDYLHWPIFKKFRNSEQFKNTFLEIFKREPESIEQHIAADAPDGPKDTPKENSRKEPKKISKKISKKDRDEATPV